MKLLTALLLPLLLPLTGCMGLLAGNYEREVAINPITGQVLTNRFGSPIYNIKRQSRSVAIMQDTGGTVEIAQFNPCGEPLPASVLKELGSNAAAEYFRSRSDCQQMHMVSKVAAVSAGRPTTAQGEVAREKQIAVRHSEQGMTDRFNSIARPLGNVGIAKVVVGGYERASDNTRKVGVAAAENAGDISTEVTMNTTQINGSHSNDSAGGGAGEGAGGSSASNGFNSNTIGDSGPINITAGRGNDSGLATDTARVLTGNDTTQQLDTSATGGVNRDSNVDQQPIIDDNNGEQSNQPTNGSNNDPF